MEPSWVIREKFYHTAQQALAAGRTRLSESWGCLRLYPVRSLYFLVPLRHLHRLHRLHRLGGRARPGSGAGSGRPWRSGPKAPWAPSIRVAQCR